jgi:hypothetical protein
VASFTLRTLHLAGKEHPVNARIGDRAETGANLLKVAKKTKL